MNHPFSVRVPFNDLQKQYASIQLDIDRAVSNTLGEFNFVRGAAVSDFEKKFASLLHANHCVATANGTDSLFLILKAYGITNGDEVITPAFSWISSAETISLTGATPVFVDVHPEFYTIDPDRVEAKISSRTKAIIAVHLYGQSAPMERLREICDRFKIMLIEDCAQGHLTAEGKYYAGTIGNAAAFSFYPTKNLGAYGDAGAVITADATLAEKVRRLANHGALQKDDHVIEGLNSRMDTLQAAILLAKLPKLQQWNTQRIRNAEHYIDRLKNVSGLILPQVRTSTTHTFHLFVVQAKQRNDLQAWLLQKGIQTIIHYPLALHNLQAYRHLSQQPESFPVANALQDRVLSLPVFPELSTQEIDYVCENIKEFFQM